MDHILRCNVLKCRKELKNHAVVTTCSHIFCPECARNSQLSGQSENHPRKCPACDMQLMNPDDVVLTNLTPTEDYKTSVLSSLSPNVIMECAGRALSFWAYQTTQEIFYQGYLAKNLSDKYASLNTQMDKIINDANAEITNLRDKLSNMQIDQDTLVQKNEELTQGFREKNRKLMQTQELYDRLKRRGMLEQVQYAASDAVDHTIQESVAARRFVDRSGDQEQRPPQQPIFSTHQTRGLEPASVTSDNRSNLSPQIRTSEKGSGTWPGFSSQENIQHNQPVQVHSIHRQRLPTGKAPSPRMGLASLQSNGLTGTPMPQQQPSPRRPLANLNGNGAPGSGFAGYGMSAGLKVSNPAGLATNGFVRPIVRSRIAQRTGSSLQANRTPNFGQPPTANMFSNEGRYY